MQWFTAIRHQTCPVGLLTVPASSRRVMHKSGVYLGGYCQPSVPVLARSSTVRSGRLRIALASCPCSVCVYLIVRLISQCRMISCITFGCTPLAASHVPVVCRRAWKSAYRPLPSTYGIAYCVMSPASSFSATLRSSGLSSNSPGRDATLIGQKAGAPAGRHAEIVGKMLG